MNQELQNYIKEERKIGTDDETIKQRLRDNGWKDEMFKDSFIDNTTSQKPYLHEQSQQAAKHNKLIFIIITVFIVLGAGAYFAFAQGWFNKTSEEVYEIEKPVYYKKFQKLAYDNSKAAWKTSGTSLPSW